MVILGELGDVRVVNISVLMQKITVNHAHTHLYFNLGPGSFSFYPHKFCGYLQSLPPEASGFHCLYFFFFLLLRVDYGERCVKTHKGKPQITAFSNKFVWAILQELPAHLISMLM